MGLYGRIAGVIGSFFQVGGPAGPGLVDDAGNIDAKNAVQTSYVNVRGADPVIANDLVTKQYGDAHYGGSSIQSGSLTISLFGDEAIGVYTGLSALPGKVVGVAITEVGFAVQSGRSYSFIPTQFNSNGFNWRVRVIDDNEPWPITISLLIDFVWST